MNGHFSDLQYLLKNVQKSESFAAHLVQKFTNKTLHMDLSKCMTFSILDQLNLIGAMKIYTKPICNLCMQARLTILKNLCEKRVTVMTRIRRFIGHARTKVLSIDFS